MKRGWLFWLLVIVFLWIVVSRFTEIEKLAATLVQGQWQWVLVAALLQALYYLVFTAVYQSAFYTVEVASRIRDLVPVVLASISYEHLNQFYNFKGLHQFKEKFHPYWAPRYLVYPGMASLPGVAIALVRADSGDDFAREYLRDLVEGWRERRGRGETDEGNAASVSGGE